jgi:hypothetical protein
LDFGNPGDDQTGFVGDDDELSPVAGVELGHDAADVRFCGERAQVETGRDLVVGQALGD